MDEVDENPTLEPKLFKNSKISGKVEQRESPKHRKKG
jgi:hypothetical protein